MEQRDGYVQPGYGSAPPVTYHYGSAPVPPKAKRSAPLWVTVLVGVVALVFGVAIGIGAKAGTASSGVTTNSVAVVTVPLGKAGGGSATSAGAAVAVRAGVGSAVDIKGGGGGVLEATLVKVVDPAEADNEFESPDPGKRFVGVQFRLVNKGAGEYDDDPQIDVTVKDAQGQSFDADFATLTAGAALDSGLRLPSGETALGFVSFQLPSGSRVAKVQYALNAFGNTGEWTVG